MNRKKLDRKQIEDIFDEYAQTFSKLAGGNSKLNEKERLQVVRSFKIGYEIIEHYYLYRIKVFEDDSLFYVVEKSLETMKKIEKQSRYNDRNKKKS